LKTFNLYQSYFMIEMLVELSGSNELEWRADYDQIELNYERISKNFVMYTSEGKELTGSWVMHRMSDRKVIDSKEYMRAFFRFSTAIEPKIHPYFFVKLFQAPLQRGLIYSDLTQVEVTGYLGLHLIDEDGLTAKIWKQEYLEYAQIYEIIRGLQLHTILGGSAPTHLPFYLNDWNRNPIIGVFQK
jgi:hypothetical protein